MSERVSVASASDVSSQRRLVRVTWDWPLIVCTALLVVFGLLMIQSASAEFADAAFRDRLHFVKRQSVGLGIGLVASMVLMALPYEVLRRLAIPAYGVTLFLMFLVMTPLGHSVNGATRWLLFGPITVQPSEIAKLALVMVLADYLTNNRGRLHDVVGVGLPGVGLLLPMMAMMVYQRDFSTTLILLGLAAVLFIIAGLRWGYVVGGIAVGAVVLAALVRIEPYRMRRLAGFADPFADPGGAGYQVVQGWIALATGGATGTGLANGVAQRGFLPEPYTDFIIAVIGEELGAVGVGLAMLLLLLLVWRALVIAQRAPDLFGMLAATGLGAMFAIQAIINVGVVGGLFPATGLVLPFLSYGASAAVINVMAVGILLKVSSMRPAGGSAQGRS
ncbi:MAG: putative lipid II flippase FtsW [Myxococcales bacterium]|nr:putative lipid II flippase FtsW [Myxococcales bacterium]